MKRNDAIEKFNQPCYEGQGDDRNTRLYWFNFMICWRRSSSTSSSEEGEFRHLKVCDGLLYEVCDNGRVLQKVTPDTQAKYQMSQVDSILLGDNDGQER